MTKLSSRMSKSSASKTVIALIAPDPNGPISNTKYLGGSRYDAFNNEMASQAVYALGTDNTSPENKVRSQQSCLEAMAGIAPQDEIEGMLAVQMIACHSAAMGCFRRAMIQDQTFVGRNQNLNFANKLARTYALHMEALDKHRGKGQQKVTVEHVHVHQGGQAIVGNVASGGGSATISEELPHAHIPESVTHSQEPALQSPLTTDRQAVPGSSDG